MKNQYDQKFYKENGFVLIKNLLTSDEVLKYKKLMNEVFPDVSKSCNAGGVPVFSWALSDGIRKKKEFWPLIWHKKIINDVSVLLGGKIKFCLHNDLHFNHTQSAYEDGDPQKISGWHRDSRFRGHYLTRGGWIDKLRGKDYEKIWDESNHKVGMARLGIYLNSYDENQTPLFLIPGSHLTERSLKYPFERIFWNKFIANIRCFFVGDKRPKNFPYIRSKSHPFCKPAKPFNAKVESGDAVLFDMRMIHGIGKSSGERCCMFLDYGLENLHTYDHVNYYIKERTDLNYLKPMPEKLEEKLKDKDLFLEGWQEFNDSPMTGRMCHSPENFVLDKYK
jgi:hypothetical protein